MPLLLLARETFTRSAPLSASLHPFLSSLPLRLTLSLVFCLKCGDGLSLRYCSCVDMKLNDDAIQHKVLGCKIETSVTIHAGGCCGDTGHQ